MDSFPKEEVAVERPGNNTYDELAKQSSEDEFTYFVLQCLIEFGVPVFEKSFLKPLVKAAADGDVLYLLVIVSLDAVRGEKTVVYRAKDKMVCTVVSQGAVYNMCQMTIDSLLETKGFMSHLLLNLKKANSLHCLSPGR